MLTEDVIRLYIGLKQLKDMAQPGARMSTKFLYAMRLNLGRIEPVFESYREVANPMSDETIKAYEEARIAMLQSLAKRDPEGNPIIVGTDYDIEDQEALAKSIVELQKQFPNMQAVTEAFNQRVVALNAEEVDVTIHRVSLEMFPDELTPEQMDGLFFMVKED